MSMSTPESDTSPRPPGGSGARYGFLGAGTGTGSGSSRRASGANSPGETKPTIPGINGPTRTPSASELAAEAEAKRRKVQRACDVCRRKKIRCEGPMNSNSASKCANCQEYGLECTYVEAAKRRGPPKGYIETLEQRCGRLERLLNQLHPNLDVVSTVGPTPDRDDFDLGSYQEQLRALAIPPYPALKAAPAIDPGSAIGSSPQTAAAAPSPPPRVLGPAPWQHHERDPNRPPDDEVEAGEHSRLAHAMIKLNIRDHEAFRFHGKASGAHLVRLVNELKYSEADVTFFERLNSSRRTEYWMVPEWEKVIATENVHPLDYSIWPDEDLASRLIDGYFEHINPMMPLLNRSIFTRQYQSGLWSTNSEFAKMCLMVFANGARYTDDERVYWPADCATTEEGRERLRNDRDGTLKYSAGWVYVRAVIKMGKSWLQGPSLLDLQITVLVCLFLNGSAVPHLAWLVAGSGIRQAQEIGIHVRSTMVHTNPIDRALYNRAFWCLYHFDRLSCAAIGRSVAIQDSDFDADYPIPVDDEYWDTGDPDRDFKQPPGLPPDPAIAAFTHLLKLDHVLGAALRTIYAVNKLPEHGPDQRAIVVELDSALNAWADSVPDNLRWDPTRADKRLFEHSAVLYAHYYYVQILIHRPFIPTRKHPENVGFPSLAICSNAARSICNILDAVLRRGRQYGTLPGHAVSIAFALPASTAAIVLLMNVYAVRQRQNERDRCMNDVKRVIAALKEMELTWRQAGKMTDLITEVARESTGDFKGMENVSPNTKRSHDEASDPPPSVGTPGAPEFGPFATSVLAHQQAHAAYEQGTGGQTLDCLPGQSQQGTPQTQHPTPVDPNGHAPGASSGPSASTSDSTAPPTPGFIAAVTGQGGAAWGSGGGFPGMPGSEAVMAAPDFFDAGDLHNLNYAVMNFDMLGDSSSPEFWTQLLRQQSGGLPISNGIVGSMPGLGGGLAPNGPNPSASQPGPGQQQPNWNFLPWLPTDIQPEQQQAAQQGRRQ
ncbi:Transcriptional activator protein acu-15 [Vanrija pseudolonga]|uniref:Transcriptional activator protein acu-15 n=1 Tax=Vanrija pseudolonga TaxID=143232 RepID=A0AAF1BNJ0_9TREE|nr:Transcriptional activator protein acu-15 [Vanrija pseudolonga]